MSGRGVPEDYHMKIAIQCSLSHCRHQSKVCSLWEEHPNGEFGNHQTIGHGRSNINCQFTLLLCQFVIIYGYKQPHRAITRGGEILEHNRNSDFK